MTHRFICEGCVPHHCLLVPPIKNITHVLNLYKQVPVLLVLTADLSWCRAV